MKRAGKRVEYDDSAASGALVEGVDFYYEGAALVFTEEYHLRRGACCGSGCRHCPFDFEKEARGDTPAKARDGKQN